MGAALAETSEAATRHGVPRPGSEPGIRVQSLEEQIHDREVEQHGGEADDGEPGRARAAPSSGRPRVDVAGEGHPDDEGPDLFGVPAPVAAPRALSPDRT